MKHTKENHDTQHASSLHQNWRPSSPAVAESSRAPIERAKRHSIHHGEIMRMTTAAITRKEKVLRDEGDSNSSAALTLSTSSPVQSAESSPVPQYFHPLSVSSLQRLKESDTSPYADFHRSRSETYTWILETNTEGHYSGHMNVDSNEIGPDNTSPQVCGGGTGPCTTSTDLAALSLSRKSTTPSYPGSDDEDIFTADRFDASGLVNTWGTLFPNQDEDSLERDLAQEIALLKAQYAEAIGHRPRNYGSPAHQSPAANKSQGIAHLKAQYVEGVGPRPRKPDISTHQPANTDVSQEIAFLKAQYSDAIGQISNEHVPVPLASTVDTSEQRAEVLHQQQFAQFKVAFDNFSFASTNRTPSRNKRWESPGPSTESLQRKLNDQSDISLRGGSNVTNIKDTWVERQHPICIRNGPILPQLFHFYPSGHWARGGVESPDIVRLAVYWRRTRQGTLVLGLPDNQNSTREISYEDFKAHIQQIVRPHIPVTDDEADAYTIPTKVMFKQNCSVKESVIYPVIDEPRYSRQEEAEFSLPLDIWRKLQSDDMPDRIRRYAKLVFAKEYTDQAPKKSQHTSQPGPIQSQANRRVRNEVAKAYWKTSNQQQAFSDRGCIFDRLNGSLPKWESSIRNHDEEVDFGLKKESQWITMPRGCRKDTRPAHVSRNLSMNLGIDLRLEEGSWRRKT